MDEARTNVNQDQPTIVNAVIVVETMSRRRVAYVQSPNPPALPHVCVSKNPG